MSSIPSSLLSSAYYQLPTGGSSTGNPSTQQTSTGTLLQALNSQTAATSNNSLFPTSDIVDLSPQAQNLLSGLSLGGSTANSSINGSGFILSSAQQQQISAILAKYKDAPFTQDTYNQIQNDLQAAGLSPQQMALQNQIKNFNPTQLLIDALSGVNSSNNVDPLGTSSQQGNTNSYMQQIYSQWQSTSSTANASPVDTDTMATTN